MKYRKYNNTEELPEELLEAIIRVAYGDAGFGERIRIRKLAAEDVRVKALLDEYCSTAESVRSIKPDECPSELIDGLKETNKIRRSSKPSLFVDFYTAVFVKPAATAAVITILMLAVIVSLNIRRNNDYGIYNKAEVETADLQAKYALSIVNKVFKSTTNSLANEILMDKVSKPINEGIKTVNKLFNQDEVKK